MPTLQEFQHDATGRRFDRDDPVFRAAIAEAGALLEDRSQRNRLQDAEEIHNRPALWGVEAAIEALPAVRRLRASRPDLRNAFHTAIGVLIRMTMGDVGWRVRKGVTSSMGPASAFRTAQRYERAPVGGVVPATIGASPLRPPPGTPEYAAHGKAALDRVAQMGTPQEQAETFENLMEALAGTRAEEGRPF